MQQDLKQKHKHEIDGMTSTHSFLWYTEHECRIFITTPIANQGKECAPSNIISQAPNLNQHTDRSLVRYCTPACRKLACSQEEQLSFDKAPKENAMLY